MVKKTGKPKTTTPPTPINDPELVRQLRMYEQAKPLPSIVGKDPRPNPSRPNPRTLTSAHLDAIRYDQYALSAKNSKEAKIYQDKADAIRAKLYPRGPSQVDRAVSQLNAKVARQQPPANISSGGTRSVLEGLRSFIGGGGLRKHGR